jgi:hypothetical protein
MNMNVTPDATLPEARLERHTVTGLRILVVDDDPAFGDATARVLRAAGFKVFLAPDHRVALEDLESTRPIDLLITDIVMPDRVNGVALSRMRGCGGRRSKSFISPPTIYPESRTRRLAPSCASQSMTRSWLPRSGGHCQIKLPWAKRVVTGVVGHPIAIAFCHWFAASARKIRSVEP